MKPLEGVRVIDLSRVLAGPHCSMMLGDMGAEVIKVEIPGRGDDSRGFGPFIGDESVYFMNTNRNKKSITLDLKSAEGKELLVRLLAEADILLENYRPGKLERLGFPWQQLQEINPGLICCHISGFGQTGPYRDRPAYDIIVQGMGGVMSITGFPHSGPTRVGISIGDLAAALYATMGVLAALRVKDLTGQGQEVDISMLDCQLALMENAIMRYGVSGQSPQRVGNRHASITPFATIRTKDSYINVAAGNDRLWHRLCQTLEDTELAEDTRFKSNRERTDNWHALEKLLEAHFERRTSAEWLDILRQRGIPCGPINGVAEILADPQVEARNMIWTTSCGDVELKFCDNPIKLSHTPVDGLHKPAPKLGEHNEEILDPLRVAP